MKVEELDKILETKGYVVADPEDECWSDRLKTKQYNRDKEYESDIVCINYNILTEDIVDAYVSNRFVNFNNNPFGFSDEEFGGVYIDDIKYDIDKWLPYLIEIQENPISHVKRILECRAKILGWALKELDPVLKHLGLALRYIDNLDDNNYVTLWVNGFDQFWIETNGLTGELNTYLEDNIEFTTDMDSGIILEIFENYKLFQDEDARR